MANKQFKINQIDCKLLSKSDPRHLEDVLNNIK